MIATIHQPEHLSYLGFWNKVSLADCLVILDNVQFEKNYFQNRNKIYSPTKDGNFDYITVQVEQDVCSIREKVIAKEFGIFGRKKLLAKMRATYGKCEFFDQSFPIIESIYMMNHDFVMDLNVELMEAVFNLLGMNVPVVYASSLDAVGSRSELLANICSEIGADTYLSGKSGRDYLELDKFDMEVQFHDFAHPTYTQKHNGKPLPYFVPYLSIIDALFNVGAEQTKSLIYGKEK